MTNLLHPTSVDITQSEPDISGTPPGPTVKKDGRNLRRQRNRDAVIRALIELIREGDLTPSVGKIADRAELSHRSVFRYFDDLNDLARTAIETEFKEAGPLSRVEHLGEGTLDERISAIVEAQIRVLRRTHLLGLVARSRSQDMGEVQRRMAQIFEMHRTQVRAQFDPELSKMSASQADKITLSIALTIWLDSYDVLYRMAGHSIDEIAAVWRTALYALLD